MIPARVSLVALGARDLGALRAFHNRLGWTVANSGDPGFAAFRTGGAVLALFPLDDLAADAACGPDGGPRDSAASPWP